MKEKKLKDLTREEIIAEHRRMWNWIADYYKSFDGREPLRNLLSIKSYYLLKRSPSYAEELVIHHSGCFACYWAFRKRNENYGHFTEDLCNYCPFMRINLGCMNGLYGQLQLTLRDIVRGERVHDNIETAYVICKKIAEMNWEIE